jgi:hypothetical protein
MDRDNEYAKETNEKIMNEICEKAKVMELCIKTFGQFTAKNKTSFPIAPSTDNLRKRKRQTQNESKYE